MSDTTDDFFEGKRPWSVIKDEVLRDYIKPYLAKVARLNKPILLIDGFAGPGIFDDGSVGSPIIMCEAVPKYINCKIFFINKEKQYHDRLKSTIEQRGWKHIARPIRGNTKVFLPIIQKNLSDQTVFLYLDPFGPSAASFELIKPFLTRSKRHSTEMVIMMHMPILHRLASRKAIEEGKGDEPKIKSFHERLTLTLGGDYWKSILWDESLTVEEKDFKLIEAYRSKLATYLPYTGYCPVREGPKDRIKYFIVFVSRHPHAMLLMNDVMIKAYQQRMYANEWQGTLFEETGSWKDNLTDTGLDDIIIDIVRRDPLILREDLWIRVVNDNFMKYSRSTFNKKLKELVKSKRLICPTERRAGQLNDNCRFEVI